MHLTITNTHATATGQGYLLHKSPSRVHGCVCGVLALESGPVAPRL